MASGGPSATLGMSITEVCIRTSPRGSLLLRGTGLVCVHSSDTSH